MHDKFIFRDLQQVLAGDLNALQDFAQDGVDKLVLDAITAGTAFSGFGVTASGSTAVIVDPGRLTVEGARYARAASTTVNLLTHVAVSTRKKVAIIASYGTQDTDSEPRNTLINSQTREYEPRVVATVRSRYCVISAVAGIEGSDPGEPVIPTGSIAVAYVLMSTTGIEAGGISIATANKLRSLKTVDDDVTLLNLFRLFADRFLKTLGSDLAALARELGKKSNTSTTLMVAEEVARIREELDMPDTGTIAGRDNFLDLTETDVAYTAYTAAIEEGLTFEAAASAVIATALATPNDSKVIKTGNFILPAYTVDKRIVVDTLIEGVNIAQYTITNRDFVKVTKHRWRTRHGKKVWKRTPEKFWANGKYTEVKTTFKKSTDGTENWDNLSSEENQKVIRLRKRHHWKDSYKDKYWRPRETTETVNGAHVGQSVLISQDGWLVDVDLYFTQLAATENVRVLLVGVNDAGSPDPETCYFSVTVDRADIAVGWNTIALPPTFLDKGMRVALLVMTAGAHYIGLAAGGSYANGAYFQSVDGAYYQGVLNRDIMMRLGFARFTQNRVEVDLAPLELTGGMNSIDILGEAIVPEGTSLTWECRKVATNVWNQLAGDVDDWMTGIPTQLAFRAVFVGTTDLMPGFDLDDTKATVSRPKTAFKHASTVRDIGVDVDAVVVKVGLEDFDPAHHTLTVRVDRAGNMETHDSLTSRTIKGPDDLDMLVREYTFNLAADAADYIIVIDGTSDSADRPFSVAYRADAATPAS